jgi:polysaccharide biosynthesis/export protein
MRPICHSICLCLALLLGGCFWQSGDPETVPPVQGDVLKPGDALRITVAGEEELSGAFTVNSDGSVRMELLGAVPAAGVSPAALEDRLRQRLAAGYLKNPQVQVARMVQSAAPPPPVLRQSQSQ